MNTKISGDFWTKTIELEAEEKLALLWFLTNDRMHLCGYCEVSAKVFSVFTGSKFEALQRAMEGLHKGFVAISGGGNGWWAREYIAEQFGRGKKLAANNMARSLVRDLLACPVEVQRLVLAEYPELIPAFEREGGASPDKGLATPCQGEREGEREREREGEGEREGEVRGVGEGAGELPLAGLPLAAEAAAPVAEGRGRVGRRDVALTPAEVGGEAGRRMLALTVIVRRRETTRWSVEEMRGLDRSGLLGLEESQFIAEVGLVAEFYAAEIPERERVRFFKRSLFSALLGNWGGELDRAQEWKRTLGKDDVQK